MNQRQREILIGRYISLRSPDYLLGSAMKAVISYECNSFMIYLNSPRSSVVKKDRELKIKEFRVFLLTNNIEISNVIVHGSYLVNLGDFGNPKKLAWSIRLLNSELSIMNEIGLQTIVIHPGNHLKLDKYQSLLSISKSIDHVLKLNPKIRIALETMSGSGTQLGSNFEELSFVIDNSEFKDRVGVCLDTCHLYSSGYDIKNNLESILDDFNKKIGIHKIWVIHLNDSLFDIGSKKDRHCNIGMGFLGYDFICRFAHNKLLKDCVKILETPVVNEIHKDEIRRIKNYII